MMMGSYAHPPVPGHHLFTWIPKRYLVTGAHVETTALLTGAVNLTVTQSLTFTTSHHYKALVSFPNYPYIVRAYHQIPVAPEDIPKTAITTPFGLFEFSIHMPFGLRNAAQTFQRFMD